MDNKEIENLYIERERINQKIKEIEKKQSAENLIHVIGTLKNSNLIYDGHYIYLDGEAEKKVDEIWHRNYRVEFLHRAKLCSYRPRKGHTEHRFYQRKVQKKSCPYEQRVRRTILFYRRCHD